MFFVLFVFSRHKIYGILSDMDMNFSFLSKTPEKLQLLIAGRVARISIRQEQAGETALEIKGCVCDMLSEYITGQGIRRIILIQG